MELKEWVKSQVTIVGIYREGPQVGASPILTTCNDYEASFVWVAAEHALILRQILSSWNHALRMLRFANRRKLMCFSDIVRMKLFLERNTK